MKTLKPFAKSRMKAVRTASPLTPALPINRWNVQRSTFNVERSKLDVERSPAILGRHALSVTLLLLWLASSPTLSAAEAIKTFATPQDAVNALHQAVNTTNRAAFATLFGPASEDLANPDSVQGAWELGEFTAAFNTTNHRDRASGTRMILE